MSLVQHFVLPKLPTVLVDDTHVELPGYDAWHLQLDNVHLIPTRLDVAKFEDALSRVLQLYPHAAGQLRRADGRWSIELTNTGVPVDVEYKSNQSTDSVLVGDWVVQDNLAPLLKHQPIDAVVVNGDAPLLRFKLTLFENETCIGVSWNHSIGDGVMLARLMNMLSQFYQDLPPNFPAPTFKKYHFPAPSPGLFSPLHPTRHFDEAAFMESLKDSAHIRWRVDIQDLEELRSALTSDGKYVSKHDCLIAYFATVWSQNRSIPIRKLTNVCHYRHVKAPFVHENVAGNLILNIRTSVPGDMAGIASAVRDAIVRARDPDCLYVLETLKSAHMLKAAEDGKIIPFLFDDDEFFVNSNVAIDWRSADFGYPESARFYTHGVFPDVLRCFKSNPVRGEDGVWRACQSIDIGLGIPSRAQSGITDTLARGVHYVLDQERGRQ